MLDKMRAWLEYMATRRVGRKCVQKWKELRELEERRRLLVEAKQMNPTFRKSGGSPIQTKELVCISLAESDG